MNRCCHGHEAEEVRVLPDSAFGDLEVCFKHYKAQIELRRWAQRNDLPTWESLQIFKNVKAMITNQKQLRKLFWQEHPQLEHLHRRTVPYGATGHKTYPAEIRLAFAGWLDRLHRDGQVSDKLAQRATL